MKLVKALLSTNYHFFIFQIVALLRTLSFITDPKSLSDFMNSSLVEKYDLNLNYIKINLIPWTSELSYIFIQWLKVKETITALNMHSFIDICSMSDKHLQFLVSIMWNTCIVSVLLQLHTHITSDSGQCLWWTDATSPCSIGSHFVTWQ